MTYSKGGYIPGPPATARLRVFECIAHPSEPHICLRVDQDHRDYWGGGHWAQYTAEVGS